MTRKAQRSGRAAPKKVRVVRLSERRYAHVYIVPKKKPKRKAVKA